jgi:hypothetical protein
MKNQILMGHGTIFSNLMTIARMSDLGTLHTPPCIPPTFPPSRSLRTSPSTTSARCRVPHDNKAQSPSSCTLLNL